MGATCNNCPGQSSLGQLQSTNAVQFPQYLQTMIDSLRNSYKDQLKNSKNNQLPKGKLFRGIFVNGKMNGYGELYNGHHAYFGNFKNDVPNGEGLIIKDFKDYIKGHFDNGKLNGQAKQMINMTQFHGQYSNGEKVKGTLKTDNYTYEGQLKNNKFNGHGTLIYKNGDKYKGNFIDGLYDGQGYYETAGQGSYKGQFKNGQYHGKGIFKWKDDYYYEGEYQNGIRNGYGKFTKGKQQYQGFWVDGQPQTNSKFIKHEQFDSSRKNEQIKAA